MAKYDRRFLVPYLQDVCSVELLLIRLQKERDQAQNNIWWFESKLKQDQPPAPVNGVWTYTKEYLIWALGCFLAFIGFFTIGGMMFDWDVPRSIAILLRLVGCGFVLGMLFFLWCAKSDFDESCKFEEQLSEYNIALRKWEGRQAERDKNQQGIDKWTNFRDQLQSRLVEVEMLRTQAYEANVIPIQYRNIYAVHFLYDFFRSGQADDLEQVLQIFVLEEIKAKLDRIIDQQTDIILNQRIMIANQEKTDKQIAENHRREMEQYAQLNENAERRNQYLEMINTNLVISNYFAYNDYIRK